MASTNGCVRVERRSKESFATTGRTGVSEADLHRQTIRTVDNRATNQQLEAHLSIRNTDRNDPQSRGPLERSWEQAVGTATESGSNNRCLQIGLHSANITSREDARGCGSETRTLQSTDSQNSTTLERSDSKYGGTSDVTGSRLVVATFNCFNWKSDVIRNLISELSSNHSQNIILALQETWRYDIPKSFCKEYVHSIWNVH